MKNYFCFNGVKIALTNEQIALVRDALTGETVETEEKGCETVLSKISVGETFKHCGYEFIVLEHLANNQTVVCFKDLVKENEEFGDNNNYNGSNVDDICRELAEEITDAIEFALDLTSDDGLDDYGVIEREVALMTADIYRKYVRILDKHKINKWWWLATPFSTATHDDTDWVKCVSPSGYINNNNYNNNNNGVRPYWWIVRQSRHKPKSEHHIKRMHNPSHWDKQKDYCMTDFERVIDFENMYNAYRKAKRGKGYKKSSAQFNIAALDGVNSLIEQLKNKTYSVSKYNEFKVYEPKERIIKTTSFKDKVVQHSLCDNVILPKLEKIFIYDNCAGQKGKGTLFGLDRLSEQMKAFYDRYGMSGYILKCDISKFFYNISHEQLRDIVEYYFRDPDIRWLCNLYIDSTEGKGVPLGNQINQGFALLYLDCMDKMIKCELGIEFYGRYMDDFYLIHPSKEYLKYCLEVITALLETLDLQLNGKTQIFPLKNGVNFLGFHTYIMEDGKVIRKLKNQNKRNAQKKYLKMAKLVVAGKLPLEKFKASYGAWKNHISHGNCYKLGEAIEKEIEKTLMRGQDEKT